MLRLGITFIAVFRSSGSWTCFGCGKVNTVTTDKDGNDTSICEGCGAPAGQQAPKR